MDNINSSVDDLGDALNKIDSSLKGEDSIILKMGNSILKKVKT